MTRKFTDFCSLTAGAIFRHICSNSRLKIFFLVRDSSAKSVQGILRGSIAQFGHFEECLSAKAPFPTQFCIATVSANVPEPNNPRDPKSLIYGLNDTVISKIYVSIKKEKQGFEKSPPLKESVAAFWNRAWYTDIESKSYITDPHGAP